MNLTCETTRWPIRHLLALLATGALRPAGTAGGPDWTAGQQALLFASPQAGWPTGQLLAWNPHGTTADSVGRWRLLDGHRRAATTLALAAPGCSTGTGGLLRDLTADEPTYLPADDTGDHPTGHAADGGRYLPVNAMRSTMRSLAATRSLPPAMPRRAEQYVHHLVGAGFDVVALRGGSPAQVGAVCARLLPGRVDPAVVHTIATAGGVWPLRWPPSAAP